MSTQDLLEPIAPEHWTRAARYFEYSTAANPVGHQTTNVPYADFPSYLHEEGTTRIVPFDLSDRLRCVGPATSPALCANFIRILAGESIRTCPDATSEVYYVIRGSGRTRLRDGDLPWKKGDFFTLPAGSAAEHCADVASAFYWVHDEPLLRYLGVKPDAPRFEPTLYPAEKALATLEDVAKDPRASERSRVSILLANEKFDQTLTITHVIWAMLGVLPRGAVQLPHRHDSVALDFIIDCQPGCYTLIGQDLGPDGKIVNPKRADWKPGSAFVTPPGYWHAHYNESGRAAHLIPIQDAGLHTYLRSLNIRFFHSRRSRHLNRDVAEEP